MGMKKFIGLLFWLLLVSAAIGGETPIGVKVQTVLRYCEEIHGLCPWYKAVLAPPPGWEEDSKYGNENMVTVFNPKNMEVPFIYVSTKAAGVGTLDQDIREAQESWLNRCAGCLVSLQGSTPKPSALRRRWIRCFLMPICYR